VSAPGFAARLSSGETLFGAWCTLPGPGPAELLAAGGVDYVVIDLQHGLASEGDLPAAFPAIEARAAAPLVRVVANDPVAIGRALDLGAHGVVIPNVDSAEDAVRAAGAALYAPRGTRGYGPFRAAMTLGADALEQVAVIAQIESRAAVEQVESIAGVAGVSALYVGPWDLSVSLGLPVPPSFDDPVLVEAIARVRAAADAARLPAGVHTVRGPDAARFAASGWRLVNVVDDAVLLRDGVAAGLERARPS
jgi:4-hydroxy-2-oxoheptanedioate aldolase